MYNRAIILFPGITGTCHFNFLNVLSVYALSNVNDDGILQHRTVMCSVQLWGEEPAGTRRDLSV